MAEQQFKSSILSQVYSQNQLPKPTPNISTTKTQFKSSILSNVYGTKPISTPTTTKPPEVIPTQTIKSAGIIPKPVLKAFNSDSLLLKAPLLPVLSKVVPKGFGEETERFRKRFLDSASFGITGEADTSLGKDIAYRDGRSFKDDALGASLDLAATLAGYAIPGLGWAKAAKAIGAGAKAIPKLIQGATKSQQAARIGKIAGQQAKEGLAVGAAIGASEVAVREAINPDNYSTKDNIGKIAIDTLGGAILDPIAYGGFKGASKLLSKIKKQPEAEQVIQEVENLKKVPEVSTEIRNVNEGTETVKDVAFKLDPTIKLPTISRKPVSRIEFELKKEIEENIDFKKVIFKEKETPIENIKIIESFNKTIDNIENNKRYESEFIPIELALKLIEFDRTLPKYTSEDFGRKNIDSLKKQILKDGLKEPLIINYNPKNGFASLGEGNHRIQALKELGYKKVPVATFLDEKLKKQIKPFPKKGRYLGKGIVSPNQLGEYNAEYLASQIIPELSKGKKFRVGFDEIDKKTKLIPIEGTHERIPSPNKIETKEITKKPSISIKKKEKELPTTPSKLPTISKKQVPRMEFVVKEGNNIGYRSGTFKPEEISETSGQQSGGRGTGHFGTGHYFFGSEKLAKEFRPDSKRPISKINLENLNLFKPKNEDIGFDLHNTLKQANNKLFEEINIEDSIKNLKQNFESNLKKEVEIDNIPKNIIDKDIIDTIDNEIDSLKEEIDSGRIFSKNDLTRIKEYFTEDLSDKLKDNFQKYNNIEIPKEKYNDLQNISKNFFNDNLLPLLRNNETKLNTEEFLSDIVNVFKRNGKNLTAQEIENIKKIIKVKSDEVDLTSKEDSISTKIMKMLGYDGVDVRGFEKLDNSQYGSVIYSNVEKKIIEPLQKITARTKSLPTKQFKNILQKGLAKGDLVKPVKSKNKREQNKDFFKNVDEEFKTRKNAPSVEELADMPIKSEVAIAKTDFKDSIEIAAKKLDTNFIDQFSPLNRLDPDIHMSKADTVRANNLTNESIYGENQVDINGNVVGRSLEKIYESSGNAEEFSKYLIYRQAISKGEKGDLVFSKEKTEGLGLTPEKMKEVVKQLEKKYPKFIKAGKEWNGYYANLRKMMLEEGNWTSDFISKLETSYPNYTPLFRDYDEKTKIAINKKSVFGGSERDVIDPYISSIELTRLFNNFMLHNRTNRELLKRVRENPESYKELGIELDTSVKMNEEEVGLNIVEELSNFEKQLKTEEINKENFITAFENGKKIKIIIKDPEIFQAFASIPQQSQGILLRGVEALTKATKMAATGTLAPIWSTKGAVMDISRALLNAENPIMHLGLVGKALFSSLARNAKVGKNLRKMADNFFNAGGGFSGALRTAPEARLPESKLGKKFRKINPLNERSYAQQYNDLFENINRIAAYDAKIRKLTGGKRPPTPKEVTLAMKYAREITTDYTVRGKIARQLEKGFPYTTASIAGTTQILKSMKKNPVKAMALIGIGAMLPALQEQARFGNDEDYKNLPNREKYRNLIIGKTAEGKFIKIPIDPQIAFLKEITNQILSAYKQQDKETFDGAMEELLNSYAPPPLSGVLKTFTAKEGIAGGIIGGLRATSLSPVVSVLTNKTFTGSPIESLEYQLSPLRPGLRYDEKTSGIAKKIGEYTNFSPMKVDYIIKNYSGDIGRVLLPLTSDVGSIRSEEFLKNFLTDPTFTNTLNVQFYKGRDNLKSARAEYTELKKEPPKWYNERLYQAINSQANGSVNKRLSYLNQLKRATSLDKNLTASQRKDKIKDIQRAINEIYLDWNTIMKKYGVPVK